MDYLLTFLEGFASFISPCVLPMIPLYLSYFAGDNDFDEQSSSSDIVDEKAETPVEEVACPLRKQKRVALTTKKDRAFYRSVRYFEY